MRSTPAETVTTHFDVLIIGAGISGLGAACHLKMRRPGTSFAILEGRDSIGGTWNLFRYPGIRSDSDMPSFGFGFKPGRIARRSPTAMPSWTIWSRPSPREIWRRTSTSAAGYSVRSSLPRKACGR